MKLTSASFLHGQPIPAQFAFGNLDGERMKQPSAERKNRYPDQERAKGESAEQHGAS